MINKIWTNLKKSMYGSTKSCFLQHQIAASELNCYDDIVSESVEEHIEKCSKFVLKLRRDPVEQYMYWVPVPASYMHIEMMGSTVYVPGAKMKTFNYTDNYTDDNEDEPLDPEEWQMDLQPPAEWDTEDLEIEAAGARVLSFTLCPNAPYGGDEHNFREHSVLGSYKPVDYYCINCGYRPTKLDTSKIL